jgi:hypothetical protein
MKEVVKTVLVGAEVVRTVQVMVTYVCFLYSYAYKDDEQQGVCGMTVWRWVDSKRWTEQLQLQEKFKWVVARGKFKKSGNLSYVRTGYTQKSDRKEFRQAYIRENEREYKR